MRLVRNGGVALAAAGALALGGTAMTVLPEEESGAVPVAAPVVAPVVAPIALVDGALSLGTGGVLDIDDTHRVAGPDGRLHWELMPAWDTTGLPLGAVSGDGVRWSLTGVEGPGALKVYEGESEGEEPVVRFDSADGLPDGYDLPAGARGETRWAFDTAGTYQLIFTAEADSEGQPLAAETRYTVRVGDAALLPVPADPTAPPAEQPATAPAPAPAPVNGVRTVPKAVTAAEPVETAKKVLDQGHIDLAARVVDGKMQIHIKDGTVPGKTTWREPSSVVLHVKPAAKQKIPASKDFAFLGKAGDPVWLLDQVQQPDLLWPGWSTENIAAGATKGEVEFKLTKAEGPGNFALYNFSLMQGGARIRFNSGDGVPDAFGVPQNTHAHGGWAFGKEGVYRLTLAMSGTLANGTKVSDTETLAFAVGTTNPSTVPVGGSTGGSSTGGSSTGGSGSTGGTGSTGGSSTGGGTDGGTTGGTTTGSTGGSTGGGSMASTGAGSPLLIGGTAAALAAVGAGFVYVTRRNRLTGGRTA